MCAHTQTDTRQSIRETEVDERAERIIEFNANQISLRKEAETGCVVVHW